MKAAVLTSPGKNLSPRPEYRGRVQAPTWSAGEVLLRVLACGVCRTDLHMWKAKSQLCCPALIPGHQIVGEIVKGSNDRTPSGNQSRRFVDGRHGRRVLVLQKQSENLCDSPTFTGYSVNGGMRSLPSPAPTLFSLCPTALDDLHAAPLCVRASSGSAAFA